MDRLELGVEIVYGVALLVGGWLYALRTYGCALAPRTGCVGWVRNTLAEITLPVLYTAASLLPRRLGRLIRPDDNPHTEADVIG